MTVKDIIKTTATLLNRQDIIDYINGTYFQEDSDTIKAVEKLNELLNLVINELCLAYVPMVKTEEVAVTNGKIYYNSFSERAVNVLEVLDANQKALGFTLKADHLILPNNASYVKYAYIPKKYSLEDEVGYTEKEISSRALSFGLCSEFCITESEFDKAVMWHERYMDAIKEVCLPKLKKIKARSWN